jgi:hypothetical protein
MKKFLFHSKEKVGYQVSAGKHKAIGRKPKKMFRLCIHDEYGARALAKPAIMLKSTTLSHEIELRIQRRALLWIYEEVVPKIRRWTAFKENEETMEQLHITMDSEIRKYRNRRLQAGLFYVNAHMYDFKFRVRSYLYGESDSEFLADLWRKKRLERKMRQTNHEISASVNESDLSRRNLKSTLGKRHTFGLLLVTSLALAIVYL